MIDALAKLGPEVSTRTFKNGFIVRKATSEWYFEYRNEVARAEATGGPASDLGLPAPNATTIEIWGFRGVRKIHGRDKSEWTQEEIEDVEKVKKEDPLMFAGHVGLSFDGGKTIWGFLPTQPADVPEAGFLDYLLAHNVVRGRVGKDTEIFERAQQHASKNGWSTELYSVTELVDSPQKASVIQQVMDMAAGNHTKGYGFPYQEAVNGSYYRDSNGYRAEDVANCAAFPAFVGVQIPEQSGNLRLFMPALLEWAAADGPMDFRTGATTEETETP
jgi:hypothetical protein